MDLGATAVTRVSYLSRNLFPTVRDQRGGVGTQVLEARAFDEDGFVKALLVVAYPEGSRGLRFLISILAILIVLLTILTK